MLNRFHFEGETLVICAGRRFYPEVSYRILVSAADFAIVNQFPRWSVMGSRGYFYAYGIQGNETVAMHRLLTGCPQGYVVDHLNWNGLDNRRDNLRVCSPSENCKNRAPKGMREMLRASAVIRTLAEAKEAANA